MDIVDKIKKWLNQSTTNKLIGITTLVYLIQLIIPDSFYILALFPVESEHFIPTQYITSVFAHGGFLHILFNMLMLYFLGTSFEKQFRSKKLVLFYFIVGIGTNILVHLITYFILSSPPMFPTLGASGDIFGLLVVYGIMYPNKLINIMFIPVGIKAKYLIGGYVLLEFILLIGDLSNLSHMAHVCGGLIGYLYYDFKLKRNFYDPSSIRNRYMRRR